MTNTGQTGALDLDAIESRVQAAQSGPYEVIKISSDRVAIMVKDDLLGYLAAMPAFHQDTAEFLAHARTDVPALVAEVRRLRSLLSRVTIDSMGGRPDLFWPDCGHLQDNSVLPADPDHDPWWCWDDKAQAALGNAGGAA